MENTTLLIVTEAVQFWTIYGCTFVLALHFLKDSPTWTAAAIALLAALVLG